MLRPRLCWGGCGLAKRHHRPLLPAGVAVGKQGLRFPLTLTDSSAQGQLNWAGRRGGGWGA